MSSRPNALIVSLIIRSTSAPTRTSTDTDLATPPAFSISAAVLLAVSARTSATITFAPSCAKRIALARPIPEPAPVINATLSLSSMISHLAGFVVARRLPHSAEIWKRQLGDDLARLADGSARWLPDRKTALVGKVGEMALDRRVVAPRFAAGHDMKRENRERQVDEHGGPSDIRRVDSKQHRDSENHDPRVQRRTKQRARGDRPKQAGGLGRPAVERRVEPLEDRDRDRGDKIPSEVVADRYAEMRARRVVPENPAEEPAVAEHAQRIDHHVHHHHEQRRHQPYARRAPDFPGVENSKIRAATIQGRAQQQRDCIAGEGEERKRQRIHERHAEHPNLARAGRVYIVIQSERK